VSIEINNESGAEVDEVALAKLGQFVIDALRVNPLADLSVVLLDEGAMAALHQQWMDLPGPTDVMAFPMDGADGALSRDAASVGSARPGDAMLGDVVLCPQVAAEQAKQAGHSVEGELHLLCTHGILHLLGYDHGEPDEEREMFELQTRLVGQWTASTGRPPINTPRPGTGGEIRDTAGGRRG